MGEERDACLVVESAVAHTILHMRHAVVLPAGMPVLSDAALEVLRDNGRKIGLKKEVAEAVELAKFALELFDVNTADGLRLLSGWRAWSYASPPRVRHAVRFASAAAVGRDPGGRAKWAWLPAGPGHPTH